MSGGPGRISRRGAMYAIVAAQMLVLGGIVAPHELNMALDSGVPVELDVAQARARKDPFRGAYVSGESALDLDGRTAAVPADGLRTGDRVLVFFTVGTNRRPGIARVERGRGSGPPFSATSFSIPGRVLDDKGRSSYAASEGRFTARVGEPPVPVRLELPASIPVDDSMVDRLAGPSLIRARLHAGFLGHRYLTDVRVIGRGWSADVSVAYDQARRRLLVLSPQDVARGPASSDPVPRSDVFIFDAQGKEVGAVEVPGRVIDAVVDPADGHVLALVSEHRWSQAEVSLARISQDGHVRQRSAPMAFDRILGFDAPTATMWIVTGAASPRSQPPYFVQRTTVAGLREPRLGPFDSVPRSVLSFGGHAWVVETDRHRVTRLDIASGRTVLEYRDLNGPIDLAADAGSLYVIEASRTQLTRLSEDGRVLWRVPRFQGLAWVLPDPGTGGGWVGASMFDGRRAGVLRFGPDGAISRVAADTDPTTRVDRRRRRLGADVFRSARDGRLLFLENQAIAILSGDGAMVTRVPGFRFPAEQRLQN